METTRHTKSRQAVLRAVKLSARAVSAEQIMNLVKAWSPEASRATVYRNLDFLTKRGEIYRVEGQDGIKRFIGHAFHEVEFCCQRCGKIRALPSDSLQEYINKKLSRITRSDSPATQRGRQAVFFSRLNAQGLCASCLKILQKKIA